MTRRISPDANAPLICFSHLRWDFVLQRPQHLMRRFARSGRRVFFFEEVIPCDHHLPFLEYHPFPADDVIALRPRVPHWWDARAREAALRQLLDTLISASIGEPPILWFYTPMMFGFADHVAVAATVYDCMDELSAFRFADPALAAREEALLDRADVVFTGGRSLYEAKRSRHANVHAFPSSVDVAHFAIARDAPTGAREGPTLGFYGVIDERLDLDLLAAVAAARPGWTIEMVGPTTKIAKADLPQAPNIRWLGPRPYGDLPHCLAGWDVALMPFAINEATRFISPTKTPEYLAAGRPIVSTPIRDVVRQYGGLEAVLIADTPAAFVTACDAALALARGGPWRDAADRLLAGMSWEHTFSAMSGLVAEAVQRRAAPAASPPAVAPVRLATPLRRPRVQSSPRSFDVLVVGCGFAGAVMAERIAAGSNRRVLVIDRRPHIAGNAFDGPDEAGILVHRYGPHIFHTNSAAVFEYLSRFTGWRAYEHRVLADVDGKLLPMPINRTTLNGLYGLALADSAAAAAFLAERAEPVGEVRTSEDVVVGAVGRHLYETFFRGYTRKQWGLDPSELDRSVTSRVPTRTSDDDRYFTDAFQAMPKAGYTAMFAAMLDHPNITVELGVDYADVKDEISAGHTVFTGAIDEFFDMRFGPLPYRSLAFLHETHDTEWFQPVGVVNYPSQDVPWTRITEYKHLTGQRSARTSITREIPSADGDPYYPVPRPENQAIYKRYERLAQARSDVSFVGRLATYRYYNMDQVVGQALATYRRLVERGVFDSAGPAAAVAASA